MATDDVVESCDRIALEAMDAALQWAAGDGGFGTGDTTAWRWGKKHTLTFEPLFPNQALNLGPFPREGDTSVVNVADSGFADLSFEARAHGPAQRFIAVAEPGGRVRARFQLPGGAIYNPSSPHYRDLLDNYYLTEQHFDLPFTTEEVVAAGEERWLLTP